MKIPFSKFKLFLIFLMSLGFVAVGFLMLQAEPRPKFPVWVLRPTGVAGVLFGAVAAVFIIVKFFSSKTGLTFTETGFYDNSSLASLGFVEWKDVSSVKPLIINKQKMIRLQIKPQKIPEYVKKIKNPIRRKLVEKNIYSFGYCISANLLAIKFEKLQELMQNEYQNFKNKS